LAGRKDLAAIYRLDLSEFMKQDIISEKTFRRWSARNPEIFVVLTAQNGGIIAYYSILPLRRNVMESVIAGSLADKEIQARDICLPGQASGTESLYFFSYVMAEKYRPTVRMFQLMYGIAHSLQVLRERFPIVKVYATPARTRSGDRGVTQLRRFQFKQVEGKDNRADGRDLYVKDITTISDLRGYIQQLYPSIFKRRPIGAPIAVDLAPMDNVRSASRRVTPLPAPEGPESAA
jgi:hypothetical protein